MAEDKKRPVRLAPGGAGFTQFEEVRGGTGTTPGGE